MANGGKDVRLGDDKRPVSIIPNSEDFLYNIANGEILTDEFGTPLVTERDQFFTLDNTAERSTSIVFPKESTSAFGRLIFNSVGTFSTVTYNANFDVRISTASVLPVGASAVGFGTTVALALGGFVDVGLGVSAIQFTQYPFADVKTLTDQGSDQRNKLYFLDDILNNQVAVNDKVEGAGIPDGTFVSKVFPSYMQLSNNVDTGLISGITTSTIEIRRATLQLQKSDNVFRIQEQFQETSEVSSSLLGIPRAETQLSLFSNVSSYGLNNDEFEFFTLNGGISFGSWDTRANAVYGNRYNASRSEEVQESAIKLEAFPVPYSYPFNANFQDVGYYNPTLFGFYLKFIQLGNRLYNYYDTGAGASQGYPSDWKDNFLDPAKVYVLNNDVIYAIGIDDSFAAIDTWTDTWRDISAGILVDATSPSVAFNFGKINGLGLIGSPYTSTTTRPGYSGVSKRYSYLQSRRVFRYQPGRISGFTFGLRVSTEPQPGAVMEWGIKNPTDQYVFRMDSGNLSIIRRSTIPLPGSVLERSGLTTLDQKLVSTGDPYNDRLYHTIEVPADKFNHDQLNGNGPSGYNIQPERVTMYKIEFGWYGAIGARFYAYIPAGVGEARWVKIHTFVIENSIGSPCLEDSFFRLTYSLDITNTELLKEPVFLYKYGASYYIDGGDEGTTRIFSANSKVKGINSISTRSLLGITPKNFILNSVGTEIKNKKLIIPTTLNITSNSLAKVEVVKCRACPGFAHVYTPGIAATTTGPEVQVRLTGENTLTAVNDTYFQSSDLNSKIIAPSIWNAYITELEDDTPVGSGKSFTTATIKGYPGTNGYPTLSTLNYATLVRDSVLGITTTLQSGPTVPNYPHPVRLSSQDNHYVASKFKFTGNKIEIQYLNRGTSDEYGHFADFTIGMTNYEPVEGPGNSLAGFNKPGVGTTTILKTRGTVNPEVVFMEHTHGHVSQDEIGVRINETYGDIFTPLRGALDGRIPRPSGNDSGLCSRIVVEVLESSPVGNISEVNYEPGPTPGPTLGNIYLLKPGLFPSGINFDGGQVKLTDSTSASAARYIGEVQSYSDSDGNIFSFVQIDQTVSSPSPTFSIDIRPVKLTAPGNPIRQKLFNFDPFPLYFFAKLGDNATVNNISIKEISGGFQRTISPKFFAFGDNTAITNAGGQADVTGAPPTNFTEVTRLSSALTDIQNEQNLRPTTTIDTIFIGEDQTLEVDMSKIFGSDRNVITPDNLNIESTFLVAKKIASGSGEIEATLNYKEQ